MSQQRINQCTLEFTNGPLPEKCLNWQTQQAEFAKKIVICLELLYDIMDLVIVMLVASADFGAHTTQIAYTLISDFGSSLTMLLFYIVLPRYKVNFPGMNLIPTLTLAVLKMEFNSLMYSEYVNIAN